MIKLGNDTSFDHLLFKDMFPNFNPNDKETFTQQSWQELFDNARQKMLPNYLVAAVESDNLKKESRYTLYDAIHFFKLTTTIAADKVRDLLTTTKIINLKIFAINCFKKNHSADQLQADKFHDPLLNLNFFNFLGSEIKVGRTSFVGLILEGCNQFSSKDERIRKVQGMVAKCLDDHANMFSQLLKIHSKLIPHDLLVNVYNTIVEDAQRWKYCSSYKSAQEIQKDTSSKIPRLVWVPKLTIKKPSEDIKSSKDQALKEADEHKSSEPLSSTSPRIPTHRKNKEFPGCDLNRARTR